MHPNNGTYRQNRAECYLKMKLIDLAISDLKEAFGLVVDKTPVTDLLKEILFKYGKFDQLMQGEHHFNKS